MTTFLSGSGKQPCKHGLAGAEDGLEPRDSTAPDNAPPAARNGHILAIDPGTTKSAFVIFDPKRQRITSMAIEENESLLSYLCSVPQRISVFAIEMIASFGFSVGGEIFDTVWWTGRFHQAVVRKGLTMYPVTRKQVVVHHTGKPTAGDSAVRAAMIARFKKENLDGCKYDLWSSLAIASFVSDHLYGKVTDTPQ